MRNIDAYFLSCFRRHAATVRFPMPCGCNIDGPDRKCDLGYALWKCAHPKKRDIQ